MEKEPELTAEELEAMRIEEENRAIEENFEAYSNLDAAEESKKLQEKELAKNKKKAVSELKYYRMLAIFTWVYSGLLIAN